jgi:hypothetical protein
MAARSTKAARQARTSARKTESAARRARHRPLVRRLARTGIGTRAFVYLVLAWLTVDLVRERGRSGQVDTNGVLEDLAHRPGGPVLVVLLGIGLVLYAGWRLLQAGAGDDSVDDGREAAKRLGWALIGLIYLGLAVQAWAVAAEGQAKSRNPQSLVASTLGVPGGRVLLAVAGTAMVAGGIALAGWAVLQRFEVFLPLDRLPSWAEGASRVVGTFGNAVRGLVLAAIGSTFFVAAVAGSPHDAKDLNSGLRAMLHHSYGSWALVVVTAGFLAFSVMSGLEAGYRKL